MLFGSNLVTIETVRMRSSLLKFTNPDVFPNNSNLFVFPNSTRQVTCLSEKILSLSCGFLKRIWTELESPNCALNVCLRRIPYVVRRVE